MQLSLSQDAANDPLHLLKDQKMTHSVGALSGLNGFKRPF
jgi:hypothetical protein